jgi:hypothetical protein
MKEKPRTRVARGTSEDKVLLWLKMSKHTKIKAIKARADSTASNLATAESIS